MCKGLRVLWVHTLKTPPPCGIVQGIATLWFPFTSPAVGGNFVALACLNANGQLVNCKATTVPNKGRTDRTRSRHASFFCLRPHHLILRCFTQASHHTTFYICVYTLLYGGSHFSCQFYSLIGWGATGVEVLCFREAKFPRWWILARSCFRHPKSVCATKSHPPFYCFISITMHKVRNCMKMNHSPAESLLHLLRLRYTSRSDHISITCNNMRNRFTITWEKMRRLWALLLGQGNCLMSQEKENMRRH